MKDNDAKQKLVENIRRVLDSSVDEVDAATQARLAAARRAALAPARHQPGWLIPAAATASIAVALVVGLALWPEGTGYDESALAIEALPVLGSPDELELYEELEFYQWLAEEQRVG
jgi:hypothetical protein